MKLVDKLVSLAQLTEEERIQAGIFIGVEEYQADFKHDHSSASSNEESYLPVAFIGSSLRG
jgi:hypothetical protein